MSSAFQPKGLENWITILDDHLLPVLPASARKIGRLLKDTDTSLNAIGDVVASDPVMRVHVVRECNRQFGDRAAGTLANPHHCVSMLGLDKLTILVRQFKATKGDAKDPRDYHYFQAISTSLHAAEQAASWAQFRNQASPDAMFIGALLYGVPTWCLWRFAHKEMHIIDTLFRRERVPLAEAELAVLGCTREQIATELAKRWHIPQGIAAALSSANLPSPRFLLRCARHHQQNPHYTIPKRTADGRLVNTPALPIALSNTLALEVARDWYSPQSRRCLDVIAAYLEQPLEQVETLAKEVALNTAQRWRLPGIQAAANGLLWPLQPRQPRRVKPAELPKTVATLYGEDANAHPPARPENKARPPQPAAKPIGIHSEHLPADLDRAAILNAPRPLASQPVAAPHPGFVSHEKKQEFEARIQKLLLEPDYFSTEYESIRCVVDMLVETTPLKRVMVATYNRSKHSLDAYYAMGCEDYPQLRKCSVSLQPSNLFSKLLKQPAALWLSPDRPAPATGLVPGSFKQASQSDTFFVMSVFNHKGAYGLFYADKGLDNRIGLSESEYKVFKVACTSCSKHLIARGKRAAAKPANR